MSYVDPNGPANNILRVGDEFIELNDEPVIDMRFEAFKESIIDCGAFAVYLLRCNEEQTN